MKYRAITMGIVQENGRPLQTFSESMEVIMSWAYEVAIKHKIDVKVYETYERVLTIARKPREKPVKETGCVCGERVWCPIHPGMGWQKGRKV